MLGGLRYVVPDFIRRRYTVKFGIALLILGLSVASIGFVATAEIEAGVEDNVEEEYANMAEQEAAALESWDDKQRLVTGMLTESAIVRSGNVERIQPYVERWNLAFNGRNEEDYVAAIHYVDVQEGEVLASSAGLAGQPVDALEVPEDDRAQLPDVPREQAYRTDPYRTDDGMAAMTYMRQVVNDPNHAIVVTINLAEYSPNFQSADDDRTTLVLDGGDDVMLDDAGFGEDGAAFLTAYDGHGDLGSAAREAGPGNPSVEHIDESPTGALAGEAYGFPEEGYVVGYQQVENTDWVVLVHQPESNAYGFVDAVSTWGTYATAGGVLLVGLIGAVLGRNTARSIDRLTAKTEAMEAGDLDVDFETTRIDNIGRLYDGFGNMRDALREQIRDAQQAREEAESERERVHRINQDLEASAEEYCDVMGQAADGDLSVRATVDADNEQMRGIGEDFNAMLDEIEATVQQLKRFASEVATASEEVTASSEEVRGASEQVTESIQEISDGAERQNDSLQSVSQEMGGLSTTTEEIAASSNEVADIAERTAETGREGRKAAQQAIEGMNRIEAGSKEAVDEIEALQEEVAQIDELLDFIAEIAEQTNMLALNANIEASRSGDSEDGFAVVAEEVKELSAETKEAAEDIEDRLERIKAQTDDTAEEVRTTSAEITDHTEAVRRAAAALDEIAEYAQETNTGVQEISAATEQQAASTQQVVAMVDEAATISEETTSEAENVAAAAEQQTTALTEVSGSASELANQAAQLSEALDRFDTDADDRAQIPSPTDIEEDPTQIPSADSDEPETGASDPVDDPDDSAAEEAFRFDQTVDKPDGG
jgi:methyl-accepting chemotaxis protein